MITVARIDKDITTMIENIMEPGVYEIIIDTGKRSADNYLLKVSYIYRLMKGLRFEYELYNHTYRGYNGYPEFAGNCKTKNQLLDKLFSQMLPSIGFVSGNLDQLNNTKERAGIGALFDV